MNSKTWISKALSLCLATTIFLTYSMVALAGTDKIAGELLITGKNVNGKTAVVQVNGETAQSGQSIFSSNTIITPADASAVVNLGKLGNIELAPNTTFTISFNEKGIAGNLSAGRLTVLSASSDVAVNIVGGKSVKLKAGESATALKSKQDDDDDDDGGAAWWIWAAVFGGAIAGIVIAATSDNNRISLGGGTTVVSPVR
jgi:hypothetical protein